MKIPVNANDKTCNESERKKWRKQKWRKYSMRGVVYGENGEMAASNVNQWNENQLSMKMSVILISERGDEIKWRNNEEMAVKWRK
jgi:hypothetical protein